MDGLILVDKPRGETSHDIVARIRRSLRLQQVGHFGTLDPLATGLLLVAVGRAVKLFPLFSKHDKVYSGEIRLGLATDTYDATGRPASAEAEPGSLPGREAVAAGMRALVGEILQAPPPYSAKKVAGKPLYKWARGRQPLACPPRPVVVYDFRLVDFRPPLAAFEVHCGSGTYVRSLAHTLGQDLGCGGHLAGLRRLRSGSLTIDRARPVDRIEAMVAEGRAGELVLPLETLLPELPKIILSEQGEARLQKGRPLGPADLQRILEPGTPDLQGLSGGPSAAVRLFSLTGRFLGLAAPGPDPGTVLPFLVFGP